MGIAEATLIGGPAGLVTGAAIAAVLLVREYVRRRNHARDHRQRIHGSAQ